MKHPLRALTLVLIAAGPPGKCLAETGPAAVAATPRQTLVIYAAGSLRAALTDLARAFEQQAPATVQFSFGPSGLLKERIEAGEPAQVFASANMSHPQALHASGKADPVQPFARNALCALATERFSLQGKALAQRLLDDDVRVATSTPKADPAGDYAFQMFDRIEATGAARPGAAAALKAKALQLTGGPNSPQAPAGRNLYGLLMAQGQADVFITYCTGAAEARQQVPSLQVLAVPEAVNVAALYGLTTVRPAGALARAFAEFAVGAAGQQVLRTHGFSAP